MGFKSENQLPSRINEPIENINAYCFIIWIFLGLNEYCTDCDCLNPTTAQPPTTKPPIGGCGSPEYAKDKYCDDENNNAGCNYDDGACCNNYAAGIPAGTGTVW